MNLKITYPDYRRPYHVSMRIEPQDKGTPPR
jgi:hypothetical protein